MPFDSIWIETIAKLQDDSGDASIGALVTAEGDGIKVFQCTLCMTTSPGSRFTVAPKLAFTLTMFRQPEHP